MKLKTGLFALKLAVAVLTQAAMTALQTNALRWRTAWAQRPPFLFSPCFRLILVIVFLWLAILARVDAQNRRAETDTLIYFKSKNFRSDLTGPNYWSSWNLSDENACGWGGVTCTNNFTVGKLDLSGWSLVDLSSSFFGDLSQLPDLTELDLSSTHYYNPTMLDDVGLMTRLKSLDLSRSGLIGKISAKISSCRSLQYLSLEHNRLTGEIPDLRNLATLKVLLLADNEFGGPFPNWLGEISTLISVDLSDNNFTGSIPSLDLPNFPKLLNLFLDNNNFTDFEEPYFRGAKNLEYISVSRNQLKGVIPPDIASLPYLRFLNLSRNRLSGEIPSGFVRPSKDYMQLDLSQNQLTGKLPLDWHFGDSHLCYGRPRSATNFSNNLITGKIPVPSDKPGPILCYDFLDFSHNRLTGPVPGFIFGDNYTEIGILRFQNNYLSGDIVDVLLNNSGSRRTTELRLENNLFNGDLSRVFPYTFGRDLDYPKGNWEDLEVLDLSNNNLHIGSSVANPDPLRALLETFQNLTELRLEGNNFPGIPLPTQISYSLSNLEVLDVSHNHLAGELSDTVFNRARLPALRFLNISNNHATGPIPESILRLPNLTFVNISNNEFSGQLPSILPTSIFNNPDIFFGNPGLCGYPLPPCKDGQIFRTGGIRWWVLVIIICGSILLALGSCLGATWRWRVYQKKHKQDADLIRTLLERESAMLMPLREIKRATDNFSESTKIGEGGFGTVFTGKLNDGTPVAIKRSKREGSDMDKEQFLNEVRILSQVNHRFLVKLLGCCMENRIAVLVFEFVPNGTLQDHLQGKIGALPLSWKQRLKIAVQTADALNYLHSGTTFPIYHRDVKSPNILLNEDLDAKVADFGISKLAPINATHVSTVAIQGTMGYIDPEYYTSFQLTDKSDVYSFGVVLLELLSAKPPVDLNRGAEESSLVYFAMPYINKGELQGLIDPALLESYSDPTGLERESILSVGRLAMKCVDMRSKARPSMREVCKELQNRWLELNGSSVNACPINEDDEGPPSDHILMLRSLLLAIVPNLVLKAMLIMTWRWPDLITLQVPGKDPKGSDRADWIYNDIYSVLCDMKCAKEAVTVVCAFG